MYDENEMNKNKTVVFEKLILCLFITGLAPLGCIYLLFTTDDSKIFWSVAGTLGFVNFVYDSYALYLKNYDGKNFKLDTVLYSQILVCVILYYMTSNFIYKVIVIPYDYRQLDMVNNLLFIVLCNSLVISNYPVMFNLFIVELTLIYYSFNSYGYYTMKDLLWVHMFLINNLFFLLIQQLIISQDIKEKKERIEMNAVTMHDLRNYVYSLGDVKEVIKEQSKKTKDQDFIIPNHNFDKHNNNTYDPDQEYRLILSFIENKINFLYHIELIFNNNYTIKNIDIDSMILVENISETLKSIFMYKNTSVGIDFMSNVKYINIDSIVFEYLIISIAKYFHDNKFTKINIGININPIANQTIIRLSFEFDYINDYFKYKFEEKSVFEKLINCLRLNTYHKIYILNNKTLLIDIFISQNDSNIKSSELSINQNDYILCNYTDEIQIDYKNESEYIYNSKFSIKKINLNKFSSQNSSSNNTSKAEKTQSVNLDNLDFMKVTYKTDDNYIFINVDDEESILRMNKRMFTKEDLNLNCCNDRIEFIKVLSKINYDMDNQIIEKSMKIVAVMDHMVDCDLGYLIVDEAKYFNETWKMKISFILLSSTEGKDTTDHYAQRGLKIFVTKPLTRSKLKDFLKVIYQSNE